MSLLETNGNDGVGNIGRSCRWNEVLGEAQVSGIHTLVEGTARGEDVLWSYTTLTKEMTVDILH